MRNRAHRGSDKLAARKRGRMTGGKFGEWEDLKPSKPRQEPRTHKAPVKGP